MVQAKQGNVVKVHYTGKLEDGSIFDTSANRGPLEFKLGESKLIAGFQRAIVGMNQGETKTVKVPAEQAYGPHREERVLTVDLSQLPERKKPSVGQQIKLPAKEGPEIAVTVTEVSASRVTLDANHPLAGKDLIFEIRLLAVA